MNKRNTVILFWNPAISSYTLERYEQDIKTVDETFNWSVWEHEKAKYGDRFFLVRCGEGNVGICMSGHFTSIPYRGEDWAGRGREVYYMDMRPDVMIHPEYYPVLSIEELQKAIPDFNWNGGHSGRILDPADAEKLELLWAKFLEANDEMFHFHAIRRKPIFTEDENFNYDEDEEIDKEVYVDIDNVGNFIVSSCSTDEEGYGKSLDEALNDFFSKTKLFDISEAELHFENVSYENDELYEKALRLSFEKHSGQKDKGGHPYYLHTIRVSKKCNSDYSQIAAFLHDTIEDTDMTTGDLLSAGFPKEIVDAVAALTRQEGESYADFIARASENKIAKEVKIADLEDNIDVKRLETITPEDAIRLEKYLHAWRYLKGIETDTHLIKD